MLSWFAAKLSSKYLPYIAIIAVIVGWTYASYSWGYSAKAAKVAVDRADGLERTLSETEARLREANIVETQGREHENEIRNIRVTLNPAGCRPSESERVRFIQRQEARDTLASNPGTMPGGMPTSEANDGS